MSKEQIVVDGVAAINAGVQQVFADQMGLAIDKAIAELPVPQPGGGFTQEDLDKARADQKGADQLVIDDLSQKLAQALADDTADKDALALVQAQLEALHLEHDVLLSKEATEAQVIAGLAQAKSVLEDVIAKLAGLQVPPVVEPQV